MGNLWQFCEDYDGMKGFSRDLAREIESTLNSQNYSSDVNFRELDKSTGYSIFWTIDDRFVAEVMVVKARIDDDNALTVHRFWGINPTGISTGVKASTPRNLRNAADAYEEVQSLLEKCYGKPISEHDGRSMYRAYIDPTIELKPETREALTKTSLKTGT